MQGNDPNSETILERLQTAIDLFNQTPQHTFQLSMSIGVQVYEPHQPISLDHMITLADFQMYQRKRSKKIQP